ncbi:PPC domain-containing protein, partial [Leptolyngbya sp. FACHB-36]|uniref:PPC domain-containing protein n=1 Tax=Leptolyngbya sp. FACHB-36 TaxID=2692808 RepID=UPI001680BE4E
MLEPSGLLQRSSSQGWSSQPWSSQTWSSQPWTEGDRAVLTTSEPSLFSSPDSLTSVSAAAGFSSAPPSLLPDSAPPTPETALPLSDDLNFEYATIAAEPTDTVGNTIDLARDLGLLSSPLTIAESVGSSDPNDFYKFSLVTDSTLDLSLTGLSADADVQLLDRAGNVIAYSDASETASEAIRRVLSAGSYAIRVYPYLGSTAYSLNLAVSAPGRSFSTSSGYGLVNAAAAVARAIGQPSFADVAAEGTAWDLTAVNAPEAWA